MHAGPLAAPVRFVALLDDALAWTSAWLDAPGRLDACCIRVGLRIEWFLIIMNHDQLVED